jgi:hypothetical protein
MNAALEVARREVKDNVATWKLPLAMVLTTLLLLAGVLSVSQSYRDDLRAHELVQDEYFAKELEDSPDALAHRFLAKPNALSLLVGGPAESVRASVASAPVVTNETARGGQDPMRLRFIPTDLGTIGVGVLSLLAILVAYDGVCGEKERGTLKVLLVNPITRGEVLAGKYLGAMATLLAPLAVALLLALAFLYGTGIRFSAAEWERLLLIFLVLVVYLSALVLLSLAVSAMTTRTAVSILALSLVWLLLVAGAGSLAAFAASADPQGRGAGDVLAEMRVLHASYEDEEKELAKDIAALQRKNETQNGTLSTDETARLRGLRADLAALPERQAQDEAALLEGYLRGREADARRAESWAALSPAEAFRSGAQKVARTDYDSARARLDEFSAYLREVHDLKAESGNGTFEPPAFRSQPVKVSTDLGRASPFLVALALQNAFFAVGAVVAFSRYDVR